MSINHIEHLREREADTCSTNSRKARDDYGHFHEKLLRKVLHTLEWSVQIWENKVLFCTSKFFKHNSRARFSTMTNNVFSLKEEELKYSCHYFVLGLYLYCMDSTSHRVGSGNQAIICGFGIMSKPLFSLCLFLNVVILEM